MTAGLVARAWGQVWRPLAAGAGVGVTAGVLGMTTPSAVVVAAAAGALTAVAQRVDATAEPRVARRTAARRDGVRGDVQDLAWSMVGRDGRAGERAVRRLREAGARRLARHGVDLADPEQADAVTALVGARAYATLTRRQHPMPQVGDVAHALRALEDLGPTRTSAPDAHPAAPTTADPPPRRTTPPTPRTRR